MSLLVIVYLHESSSSRMKGLVMITSPINFVDAAVSELIPDRMRLPSIAWSTLALFGKARSFWRWYRQVELYSNPKNFVNLLAGHVLDYVVGDRLLIRIAAHSLLIATRLLECAQAEAEVKRSGEELLNAVLGRYLFCVKEPWLKGTSETYGLSPSTVAWWKRSYQEMVARIARIGLSFLQFVRHSFELTMHIADAIDVFYMPPEAQAHSVHTCFVNAAKWLEAMTSNKEELLFGLSDNKDLIQRIIKHSPFTYDQLYQSVAKNLDRVELLHDCSHAVSELTGGIVFEVGKRALNGGLVVLGAGDYRPAALAL
jgi:hypothetical protein